MPPTVCGETTPSVRNTPSTLPCETGAVIGCPSSVTGFEAFLPSAPTA